MSNEYLYSYNKGSLYSCISRTLILNFIILKIHWNQISKECLKTVYNRSLYKYISRTFRLNFIILNVGL